MTSRLPAAITWLTLATGGIGLAAAPAHAEPPTHVMNITRDISTTIPPLVECPAPNTTSLDLVLTDVFHLVFTDTTFHLTETQIGTFTSRSAGGDVVATGRFTTTFSDQGPGFPTESLTSVINATGTTADGSHVLVRIAQHLTITPAGDVTVSFTKIGCG
jgi:hypothetical protein